MLKTKKWMKQTSLQVPASNQPSAGWTGFLPYGSSLPWLCELFWEISWRIQALPFRKEILLEFPFQLVCFLNTHVESGYEAELMLGSNRSFGDDVSYTLQSTI
jgi:hypothetical protein